MTGRKEIILHTLAKKVFRRDMCEEQEKLLQGTRRKWVVVLYFSPCVHLLSMIKTFFCHLNVVCYTP